MQPYSVLFYLYGAQHSSSYRNLSAALTRLAVLQEEFLKKMNLKFTESICHGRDISLKNYFTFYLICANSKFSFRFP